MNKAISQSILLSYVFHFSFFFVSYVNSRSKCEMYFNFVVSHGTKLMSVGLSLSSDSLQLSVKNTCLKDTPSLSPSVYCVIVFSPLYDVICILEIPRKTWVQLYKCDTTGRRESRFLSSFFPSTKSCSGQCVIANHWSTIRA